MFSKTARTDRKGNANAPQLSYVWEQRKDSRGLYSFVLDLAYRAYILNGNKEPSGVVLIDEIDLHLHPSLEQEVVQCLRDIFPNVEIKGGVCHFLSDRRHNGKCNYSLNRGGVESSATLDLGEFDILIREPKLALIVSKVLKHAKQDGSDFVENSISPDTPFGIPTNPEKSKKTRYEVSDNKRSENDILLYYLNGGKRVVKYIDRTLVPKNSADIDAIKVFVPAAYGASESFPHQILGMPEYAPSGSVCSQTYLYLKFDNESEAKNFISYLKTRFFRALVSAIKITQHAQTSVYHFVPMQDFSHSWTDADLFKKYDLTPDEVKYIESMIKPMVDERAEQMDLNFVK